MANVFKSKNYDYSYPRVRLSTTALRHSSVQPDVEDTTILFAAFASEKGPTDKIVRIHTLSEFIMTYGNLDYDINRQTALNIYNWLNAGGTVYALRLINPFISGSDSNVGTKYIYDARKGYYRKSESTEVNNNPYVKEINTAYYDVIEGGSYSKETIIEGEDNPSTTSVEYFYARHYSRSPLEAKYPGEYYKNIHLKISAVSQKSFNLEIYHLDEDGNNYELLEQYYRLTGKTYKSALSASQYIGYIDLSKRTTIDDDYRFYYGGLDVLDENLDLNIDKLDISLKLYDKRPENHPTITGTNNTLKVDVDYISDYQDINTYASFEDLLATFWNEDVKDYIGNPLETPIDVILDAGYSDKIKNLLVEKLGDDSLKNIRDDIFLFLDCYYNFETLNDPLKSNFIESEDDKKYSERLAVYDQYFTVNDATFTGQDIYVSPTYYISKLLPYIDINYGVQWPMSGIRRAVLEDVKDISNNPGIVEKDTLFKARINYAEKTARECAFMSQRTYDGSTEDSYTALSFINNSRTLEKIKKDLARIGREYLFEFNDSITLSNMGNVLNKYLNNWVSNRTLSYAEAVVSKDRYNDEAVNVTLVVKFTGTIEVISVDITIE